MTHRIQSHDLFKMGFLGDPQVSPDGNRLVYVKTEPVPEKDGYRSTLWMATRQNDGGWLTRQFTNPCHPDRLIRDHSPRWSPDGKHICFVSNREKDDGLFLIQATGGEAKLLMKRETRVSEPTWSPTGKCIAFTSPAPEELEPEYAAFRHLENGDETPPRWDGEELPEPSTTYVTRLRYKYNGMGLLDDRYTQLFTVNVETAEVQQLTSGPYNNTQPTWSPEGNRLAFTSARRPDREHVGLADLWTIPAEGGDEQKILTAEGPIVNPTWSPDGRLIAYLGHEQGEFSAANTRAYIVPSSGGTARCLTTDFDRSLGNSVGGDTRFDAGQPGPYWTNKGDALYFLATDGGQSHIYRVELATEDLTKVSQKPPVLTSLHVQAPGKGQTQVLAAVGQRWDSPGEVYAAAVDAAADTQEMSQVTRVNEPLMEARRLSRPERFEFKTSDGTIMEAWIIKPLDFDEDKLYPVVLEIHGGPAGTYGTSYFHEFQVLASRGYGVLFTNPRGSKGYGEEWAKGVIGDWGGDDYADLMACVDSAVARFAWIDPDRLGVTGGSYGGYMTNWIVGQTDRFRAAVTQRSISNLYTKYGVSDIGFFANRAGMGGADLWEEEDFIMSRSPIRHAPNVRTPILIIHAEEDLRCPMEQAEQWYIALRRLGNVEVEFVRFAEETHELSRSGKPVNRVERLEQLVSWFEKYTPANTVDKK